MKQLLFGKEWRPPAMGKNQRMAAASNGQKPPELLSTHPSDESRINQIKKYLPDALKYYKPVR